VCLVPDISGGHHDADADQRQPRQGCFGSPALEVIQVPLF